MTATPSSSPRATPGGIAVWRPITTTPTARSEAVCPRPQSAPTSEELHRLRRWLTIVETAAR